MRVPVVYEDEHMFVLESTNDKSDFPRNISALKSKDLETVKQAIDGMISTLVRAMKTKDKRVFESIMHEENVHVDIEDNEWIIIP